MGQKLLFPSSSLFICLPFARQKWVPPVPSGQKPIHSLMYTRFVNDFADSSCRFLFVDYLAAGNGNWPTFDQQLQQLRYLCVLFFLFEMKHSDRVYVYTINVLYI
jgi:hypothetical protein